MITRTDEHEINFNMVRPTPRRTNGDFRYFRQLRSILGLRSQPREPPTPAQNVFGISHACAKASDRPLFILEIIYSDHNGVPRDVAGSRHFPAFWSGTISQLQSIVRRETLTSVARIGSTLRRSPPSIMPLTSRTEPMADVKYLVDRTIN